MPQHFAYDLPFGATPNGCGETRFRIWAPSVAELVLECEGAAPVAMNAVGDGWFEAVAAAAANSHYRYRLPDGLAVPDPASRRQSGDVHGFSVVVDPRSYSWNTPNWRGRPWHEAVVYELHPGAMGGFSGITADLPRLRDLGITAVELMPIADFPGRRNWGYDGVLPYAPDEAYGTPDELKALIDTAHGMGLMVLLDVVYNHFGPDGAYLHAYAREFFDEGKHTPWGAAIDFKRPEVRDYFTHNALMWLMEYRFDGLRFDAVHAISEPSFLPYLARTIREGVEPDRHVHLILEHEGNASSLLLPGLFDAQWADDAHHCWHVLLTGETEGYYEDFSGAATKLARAMAEGFAYQGEISPHSGRARGEPSGALPSTAFVFCLQNHDQIGNRALGERLNALADPEALRAAVATLLLSPHIPMIFMGEEVGSTAPFLFFTDHNEELADLVRDGRRKEFAHFAAFSDPAKREMIPDPNAPATFQRSVPDLAGGDPATITLYRSLLAIRHRHVVPRIPGCLSLGAQAVGNTGVRAQWRMGDGTTLTIAGNFGTEALPLDPPGGATLFESHRGDADAVCSGMLPARTTVVLMQGAA